MKCIFSVICLFLITIFLCLCCSEDKSVVEPDTYDIFYIHIAGDDIDFSQTIQLDELNLLQPAFLSTSDITAYKWDNHHITYPDSVWERLKTWGNLLHKYFVVSVGNDRIYCGRFMDYLDSGGCQNPVICLIPRHPDGRNTTPDSILIERGYPEYIGIEPDPRTDTRIYNSLKKASIIVP